MRLQPARSPLPILARPEGHAQLERQDVVVLGIPVSILARPEGRAQLDAHGHGRQLLLVSILARPEGRAQPRWSATTPTARSSFNPRPTRGPGAARDYATIIASVLFQSSPDPRAGRSVRAEYGEGRALNAFQSSPDPRAGRSVQSSTSMYASPERFNPRPTRGPGAATATLLSMSAHQRFQSSPDPRAGRSYSPKVNSARLSLSVSILARPEGRAQPCGPPHGGPTPWILTRSGPPVTLRKTDRRDPSVGRVRRSGRSARASRRGMSAGGSRGATLLRRRADPAGRTAAGRRTSAGAG